MITNKGKSLLSKYLVGQIPAYASYIAIGCGSKPVADTKLQIDSISVTGNVATLTVPNHHFYVGSNIRVENVGPVFDGAFIVTEITLNTISYEFPSANIEEFVPEVAGYVFANYSKKNNLDFEMFRVPISSRGFVNENGVSKIVFTAAMPTEERYEITEVGVFSAGSNPVAGVYDSKSIYSFGKSEGWESHTSTGSVSAINTIYKPLNYGTTTDVIASEFPTDYFVENTGLSIQTLVETPVFRTNADNLSFTTAERLARYERPRFFNDVIVMQGDNATLDKFTDIVSAQKSGNYVIYETANNHLLAPGETVTISGTEDSEFDGTETVYAIISETKFSVEKSVAASSIGAGGTTTTTHFIVKDGSNHIHLTGTTLNLDKNSPADELRLAFSVINKDGQAADVPDSVRIMVEFASSDVHNTGQYARLEAEAINEVTHDLANNRYVVASIPLSNMHRSSGFTWASIDVAKVYVSTIVNDVPVDSFYIALDALRLENVSSVSSVYGLTGYSVISSSGAKPVVKLANTTNFVEFRFALEVD